MVAGAAVAEEYKDLDEPLADFIKRKGGINECAARFARRLGRGSVPRAAVTALRRGPSRQMPGPSLIARDPIASCRNPYRPRGDLRDCVCRDA